MPTRFVFIHVGGSGECQQHISVFTHMGDSGEGSYTHEELRRVPGTVLCVGDPVYHGDGAVAGSPWRASFLTHHSALPEYLQGTLSAQPYLSRISPGWAQPLQAASSWGTAPGSERPPSHCLIPSSLEPIALTCLLCTLLLPAPPLLSRL